MSMQCYFLAKEASFYQPRYLNPVFPNWEKLFATINDSCPNNIVKATYHAKSDTLIIDSLISGYIQLGSTVWYPNDSSAVVLVQDLGSGMYLLSDTLNIYPDTALTNKAIVLFSPTNVTYQILPTDTNHCISYRKRYPHKIEEIKRGFLCYPSPASNFITIENPIPDSKIYISDITGKILKSLTGIKNKFEINIHELEPGIYIIHDNYGNSHKFIKL